MDQLDRQLGALGREHLCPVPSPLVSKAVSGAFVDLPATHCVLTTPVTSAQGRLRGFLFVALPGTIEANESELDALHLAAHHLTALIQSLDRANGVSMWDAVTGLHNQKYLEESLPRIWELAKRNQHPMGILTIDLDGFTAINEAHGFSAGDRIMKEATERMRERMSAADLLIRQRGDTFLILLTNPEPNALEKLAKEIHTVLTSEPYLGGRGDVRLGATVAGAISGEDSGIHTSQQLLDLIHRKIQELKSDGGNRVGVFTPRRESESPSLPLSPVLVVDDDPQVAKLLSKMMGTETVDMTCVQSVDEAERLLESGQRFHVMLTDISMPGRDGFAMLRLAEKVDPDMVNLVTSGDISKRTEQLLIDAGSKGILRKPFKLQDVRNQFSSALQDYAKSKRKRQMDDSRGDSAIEG